MLSEIAKGNITVIRNLKDAGCDSTMIDKFLQLKKDGKIKEQLRLLSCQRTSLLHKVHENQKKIDCLDFLIFNMMQKK